MGNFSGEQMELPPGFRFHPTDEELITHYLTPKVDNGSFSDAAIGEVDLNKVEPWDLPWKAKMGEKEWYFFCVRDRKYPTGLRTNRATESGYWKATGKDKEIHKAITLVGMKKTLVFYKGRAPRGEKTNWVMHEYRLEGKYSMNNLPQTAKNEWVISRIFHKSSGGKKTHISGLVRLGNYGDEFKPSSLPPLLDISRTTKADTSHVTCFSEQMEDGKFLDKNVDTFNPCVLPSSSPSKPFDSSFLSPKIPISSSFCSSQISLQYPESLSIQDQSILRYFLEYHEEESEMKNNSKTEFWGMSTDMSSSVVSNHEIGQRSYEDQEYPITSGGPVDLDCLWNY